MSARSVELGTIRQHCKTLRMPTVASQFQKLAEQAWCDKQSHVRYLDVLLSAEVEEREHRAVQRRLKEAQLPRTKTVDEFDFSQSPKVSGRRIKELAEGHYIDRAQPVIFLGDAGTGKTHLASALCVAACQQRRRVRFTTASKLVNELVEARQEHELSRIIRRYARFELLCIDELGYVPLADVGAELLFQVISERSETAALVITTNLPFSEWTQVFTNARLCKALLDRVTDQAHILETGTESYRFRHTVPARTRLQRHESCVSTPGGLHVRFGRRIRERGFFYVRSLRINNLRWAISDERSGPGRVDKNTHPVSAKGILAILGVRIELLAVRVVGAM